MSSSLKELWETPQVPNSSFSSRTLSWEIWSDNADARTPRRASRTDRDGRRRSRSPSSSSKTASAELTKSVALRAGRVRTLYGQTLESRDPAHTRVMSRPEVHGFHPGAKAPKFGNTPIATSHEEQSRLLVTYAPSSQGQDFDTASNMSSLAISNNSGTSVDC